MPLPCGLCSPQALHPAAPRSCSDLTMPPHSHALRSHGVFFPVFFIHQNNTSVLAVVWFGLGVFNAKRCRMRGRDLCLLTSRINLKFILLALAVVAFVYLNNVICCCFFSLFFYFFLFCFCCCCFLILQILMLPVYLSAASSLPAPMMTDFIYYCLRER